MFENQIAIETGGEPGVGAACAKALGASGARVVITYSSDEVAPNKVCASIGDGTKALSVKTNVGSESGVEAAPVANSESIFPRNALGAFWRSGIPMR